MRRCYVAGPMRGVQLHNFPRFFAAEGTLRRAGWSPRNPARLNCRLWAAGTVSDPSTVRARRLFAAADLRFITSLRPDRGDAVVVLPGWSRSVGARAEVAAARWVGIAVLTLEEATRGSRRRVPGGPRRPGGGRRVPGVRVQRPVRRGRRASESRP